MRGDAMRFGWGEIIVILVIVLLIIGPKRLPELGRGLADAIAEFRKGRRDRRGDDEEEDGKKPDGSG